MLAQKHCYYKHLTSDFTYSMFFLCVSVTHLLYVWMVHAHERAGICIYSCIWTGLWCLQNKSSYPLSYLLRICDICFIMFKLFPNHCMINWKQSDIKFLVFSNNLGNLFLKLSNDVQIYSWIYEPKTLNSYLLSNKDCLILLGWREIKYWSD